MLKSYRIWLLAAIICLGWGTRAHAGLQEAAEALNRGDYTNGMPLLKAAAEDGDIYAQVLMGQFLVNGKAGQTDLEQAVVWYQKAANSDVMDSPFVGIAQHNLASLYYTGRGVAKDTNKAVELYKQAAARGYATSQSVLVGLYYRGESVKKDIVQALKWAIVLAKNNPENAKFKLGLQRIRLEATPEEYATAAREAKKLAQVQSNNQIQNDKKESNFTSPQQKFYDIKLNLPDGFHLAFKDVQGANQIYQYVPAEESVKKWGQMITIMINKLNQPVPNIAELLVQNTLQGYSAQCKSSRKLNVSLPQTNSSSAAGGVFCDDIELSKIPAHIYARKNGFILVKALGSADAVYSIQYEWQSDIEPSSFVESSGLLKDVIIPIMTKSDFEEITAENQAGKSPQ